MKLFKKVNLKNQEQQDIPPNKTRIYLKLISAVTTVITILIMFMMK